jgi:hypothetical protein
MATQCTPLDVKFNMDYEIDKTIFRFEFIIALTLTTIAFAQTTILLIYFVCQKKPLLNF